MLSPAPSGQWISVPSDPKLIEMLTKKREVISNLCKALESYLCYEIDFSLSSVNDPPKYPQFTPEMLVKATNDRNFTQSQIDLTEKNIDKMPKMLQSYCKTMVILPLKRTLEQQEEWIKQIQEGLEKS